MKKLLLQGRRIGLGFVTPLLLHSPTMAQNEQVSDEVSRIAAALIVVESDYVTPITEATLAIACRDGILKASNALSAEANTLINESRFDVNSFPGVVRLIPRILERPANAVSARMLGDACLQNVFEVWIQGRLILIGTSLRNFEARLLQPRKDQTHLLKKLIFAGMF